MKALRLLAVLGAVGFLAACTTDLDRIRTTEASGGTPFTQALTSEYRDLATIQDVTLWNFRVGYTPADHDNVQVWLFVDNLTDENYYQGGFSNTESLGAGSYVLGTPLTYGIEASVSF